MAWWAAVAMRIDDLLLCLNLKPAVESRPNFGPSAAASVDAPCKGLGLGAAELGAAGVISSLPTALGTSAALPTAVQNPRQPMHWQQLPPQLERKLDVLRNDAEPVCRLKSIQHAQHGVHATVPSEVTHRPLVPVSTSADFAGPKAAETWGSQSHMLQTVLPDNASCQIPPVLPVGKRQAPGTVRDDPKRTPPGAAFCLRSPKFRSHIVSTRDPQSGKSGAKG
eukprot:SAG31_NODE_3733_length_3940_cov_2.160115_6_plen_223_part_00